MAIDFAHVYTLSRSRGKNAIKTAAYMGRARLYDEKNKRYYDYSKRNDVLYEHIYLPEGVAPAFMQRAFLWNRVEESERRKNSVVAKHVILSLPKEVSLPQQIHLLKTFTWDYFVSHQLIVDMVIHDDTQNPHAHLLVPTRTIDGLSFSRLKAPEWTSKCYRGRMMHADAWKIYWRQAQHDFFMKENVPCLVDCPALLPGRKQPQGTVARAAYWLEEAKRHQKNQEKIKEDPYAVIAHLSQYYGIWHQRMLMRFLYQQVRNACVFKRVYHRVLQQPELIFLGCNEQSAYYYTEQSLFEAELQLQQRAGRLNIHRHHGVPYQPLHSFLRARGIECQAMHQVIDFLIQGGSLRVLLTSSGKDQGNALHALRVYYQQHDYQVHRVVVTGLYARSFLNKAMPVHDVDYFLWKIKAASVLFEKSIVILEEAERLSTLQLTFLLQQVERARSKVIIVGSTSVLQLSHVGAALRALLEKVDYTELLPSQTVSLNWQQHARRYCQQGEVLRAIRLYRKKQQLHLGCSRVHAMEKACRLWKRRYCRGESVRILTLTQEEAEIMNRVCWQSLSFLHPAQKKSLPRFFSAAESLQQQRQYGITSCQCTILYLGSQEWDRYWLHRALGHSQNELHWCVDQSIYHRVHTLSNQLKKTHAGDGVIGFPLHFSIRRGLSSDVLFSADFFKERREMMCWKRLSMYQKMMLQQKRMAYYRLIDRYLRKEVAAWFVLDQERQRQRWCSIQQGRGVSAKELEQRFKLQRKAAHLSQKGAFISGYLEVYNLSHDYLAFDVMSGQARVELKGYLKAKMQRNEEVMRQSAYTIQQHAPWASVVQELLNVTYPSESHKAWVQLVTLATLQHQRNWVYTHALSDLWKKSVSMKKTDGACFLSSHACVLPEEKQVRWIEIPDPDHKSMMGAYMLSLVRNQKMEGLVLYPLHAVHWGYSLMMGEPGTTLLQSGRGHVMLFSQYLFEALQAAQKHPDWRIYYTSNADVMREEVFRLKKECKGASFLYGQRDASARQEPLIQTRQEDSIEIRRYPLSQFITDKNQVLPQLKQEEKIIIQTR